MTRDLQRQCVPILLALAAAVAGCNDRKLRQTDGGPADGGGDAAIGGKDGGGAGATGGSAAAGTGGNAGGSGVAGGRGGSAAAGTGGSAAGGTGGSTAGSGGSQSGGGTGGNAAAGTGGSAAGGTGGSAAGGTGGSAVGGSGGSAVAGTGGSAVGGTGGSAVGGTGGAPCPSVDGMVMVRVPAGFCIDTTEVTRAQYAAWLARTPSTAGQPSACASNTSFEPPVQCLLTDFVCAGVTCDNHPQVCIDWCDARAYCAAVGKRLCGRIGGGPLGATPAALSASTSEWMNACTVGGASDWPYGTVAVDGRCNTTISNNSNGTVPVGSRSSCTSPTPGYAGIFDMVGNVWEMQDACDDTTTCVIRGGSFADVTSSTSGTDRGCATSYEWTSPRGNYSQEIGFRCCAD